MMTQFKILLFLVSINVVAYMVLNAQTGGTYIFPGVQYSAPMNGTGSMSDLEQNFNGTNVLGGINGTGGWQPSGNYGWAGDIFSGLNMFWNTFRFLIDGLGMTIDWVGSMIPAGQIMFNFIAWIFRILGGVIFVTLVYEMITGRNLME